MSAGLPPWLDDVHAFLARLRGAPFRIGVGDEARVLCLLDRLRHCDATPQSAEAMAQWLGPVCCTSGRQQAMFADELARWAREHGAVAGETAVRGAAAASALPAPVAAVQRVAFARRWLLLFGIAAMVVVVLLATSYLWRRGVAVPAPATVPEPDRPPGALSWDDLRRIAGYVTPLLGFAAFLTWQRQRPQSLARRFVAAATPAREVSLKAARRLLFAPRRLSHHFQALRRHHEVPSNRIDIARSLRATVRAGGAVQLQFATRRRLPDYLVMIDRVSVADHEGALADVVLRRFAEEQVPCHGYDFHGDPRRSRPSGTGSTAKGVLDLADLAALHGEHPLILFTEAERFFAGEGEKTQVWVEQLLAWPLTVIFTPKPRAEWSARERQLQAMGFVVLPATPLGIGSFAELLNAGSTESPPAAAIAAEQPLALLSVRADRWVRQTAPSQREIDALLAALPAALGARAFELLCATAVFPAVDAEVTLWLADALGANGSPLLDEESFGRLARLPWMRRGCMPDWLRLALIARLGPASEAKIRRLCLQLLRPRSPGNEGFKLDIATGNERTWLAMLLAALQQDEDSTLRDTIFLGFVRRNNLDPLVLRAPGELSRLLRPPRMGALEWLAAAATAVATALLWNYDLALGALVGRAAEWVASRLQVSVAQRGLLVIWSSAGVAAALAMWHFAIFGGRAEPRRGWLAGARAVAALGALAAWSEGAQLVGACTAAVLLTWLPPRPRSKGRSVVLLGELTRGGGWLLTSVGTAIWLWLLYDQGVVGLLQWLTPGDLKDIPSGVAAGGFPEDFLPGGAVVLMLAALMLAALAAGRRLQVRFRVSMAAGGAGAAAAAFCLALATAPGGLTRSAGYLGTLGLTLLVAAAWGAMLVLWLGGRAQPAWVVRLAAVAACLLGWGALLALALRELASQLDAATLARGLLLANALPVVGVFIWALQRRGLLLSPMGRTQVWGDGRSVTVRAPGLRLFMACGLLLFLPVKELVTIDANAITDTKGLTVGWFYALVLLVPALRLAAPELFRSPTLREPGKAPTWAAWPAVPLLWLLALSYDFGFGPFPQATYLFVPLAAWWASRFGRAGWAPFATGACPLLIGYFNGPVQLGGATGVFLAAVIVYRLVAENDYREATFQASRFGLRQLLYLLLVGAITVSSASFSGVRIGSAFQPYLALLLLLLGMTAIRSRLLPWALTLGLAFGLALRMSPSPTWLGPPTFPISVDYGISDPSVLVGALLALYGPAYMWQLHKGSAPPVGSSKAQVSNGEVLERMEASVVGVLKLSWLPAYLVLFVGFIDVYFGVSVDIVPQRLSVSLLNTPGLMVVAFLIGLFEPRAAMWRVGILLLVLLLAAAGIDFMAADMTAHGVLGWGLRYSVSAVAIAQGAAVVAAYVWLGVQVGMRGDNPITLQLAPRAIAQPTPDTLPQLRFAYMDILLMIAAAGMLSLRALMALNLLP